MEAEGRIYAVGQQHAQFATRSISNLEPPASSGTVALQHETATGTVARSHETIGRIDCHEAAGGEIAAGIPAAARGGREEERREYHPVDPTERQRGETPREGGGNSRGGGGAGRGREEDENTIDSNFDSMEKMLEKKVTDKFKNMTKAFRFYDRDQSNTLDKEEMRGLLQACVINVHIW